MLNKKCGDIHYIDTLFPDSPLYEGYYLFNLPSGVPMAVELVPDSGTARPCQCCAMRYACQNKKNNPEGKLVTMCNWGYFRDFTYLDFETALELSITLYRAVCKRYKKRGSPTDGWAISSAKLEVLKHSSLKGFNPFYRLLTELSPGRCLLCFMAGADGCINCGELTKLYCGHSGSPYYNEDPEGVLNLLLLTKRRYRRNPLKFSRIGRRDIATPLRPHI